MNVSTVVVGILLGLVIADSTRIISRWITAYRRSIHR